MNPILKKIFLGTVTLPVLVFIMSALPSVLDHVSVTYTDRYVNRKTLFIFCNAILLFVAKDSGLLVVYSAKEQQGKASATNRRDLRPENEDLEVKTGVVVEEGAEIVQTVEEREELDVVNVQPLLPDPNPIEEEEVNDESVVIVSREKRLEFKSGVGRRTSVHFTLSQSAPLCGRNVKSTKVMKKEPDVILPEPDASCGIDEETGGDVEIDHAFNRRCTEFIINFKRDLSGKGTMESV